MQTREGRREGGNLGKVRSLRPRKRLIFPTFSLPCRLTSLPQKLSVRSGFIDFHLQDRLATPRQLKISFMSLKPFFSPRRLDEDLNAAPRVLLFQGRKERSENKGLS